MSGEGYTCATPEERAEIARMMAAVEGKLCADGKCLVCDACLGLVTRP